MCVCVCVSVSACTGFLRMYFYTSLCLYASVFPFMVVPLQGRGLANKRASICICCMLSDEREQSKNISEVDKEREDKPCIVDLVRERDFLNG